MADSITITRKIEVRLHKEINNDDDKKTYEECWKIWRNINDNLYKAANLAVSHCFFNDSFKLRAKIHNREYSKITKELKNPKLTTAEKKQLKKREKEILNDINNQFNSFTNTSEQNSVYQLLSSEYGEIIPSNVLTCLNQNISSLYRQYKNEVEMGKRTIQTYKKGLPVPFPIKRDGQLLLKKRDDGSIYIQFPKLKLPWDLYFGRDKSNNREIVERILSNEYDAGNSSLQQAKNGKVFLLLVVKIPKQNLTFDHNRVVGIDLGINTPLYAALNDNPFVRMSIGSRDQFLNMRLRFHYQKRELQQQLRLTNGGHGRNQKLKALERFRKKERNWVHLQNHIFSKAVIDFAQKNNAGVINMERLKNFGKDSNNEANDSAKFILRNWSYFELQTMIESKASKVNIEVRYINPYHTSQTCSFCGHYEPNQRVNQSTFICKNPDCEDGKGKKNQDGSYSGINADWNAARNIALSTDFVED